MPFRIRLSVASLLAALLIAPPALQAQGRGVGYFLTGSAADAAPAAPPATASAVLMGGGSDVDEAMRWMVAKSGGGDFVVLRASGSDGYNAYLYAMGGLDSVETLVVKTRQAASDPFVVDRITRAEAIFIAGGDQADYIRLWKDTPLSRALDAALARKVPIGGTSAGLAVLGAVDYAALNGSVDSATALANPYHRDVTLDSGFLVAPFLQGTVTDSHFRARDRMGRLVAFTARLVQDGLVPLAAARGIGIDEETALVVDDGIARRMGRGAVYLLRPLAAPQVCQPRKPLTLRNVAVDRLADDAARVDLRSGAASGSTRYELSAENGRLLSSQPGGGVY